MPYGPRSYRRRLRQRGPLLSLAPPAALGLAAWRLASSGGSLAKGVLSFLLGTTAAPGLLVAGIPLTSGGGTYLKAIAGSAALWLAIGVVAAHRATRSPVASWRDFWREWAWLAGAVWIGVIVALVAANLVLGRALF